MNRSPAVGSWNLLLLTWLVALMSSLSALFIGEVMGQAPCAVLVSALLHVSSGRDSGFRLLSLRLCHLALRLAAGRNWRSVGLSPYAALCRTDSPAYSTVHSYWPDLLGSRHDHLRRNTAACASPVRVLSSNQHPTHRYPPENSPMNRRPQF